MSVGKERKKGAWETRDNSIMIGTWKKKISSKPVGWKGVQAAGSCRRCHVPSKACRILLVLPLRKSQLRASVHKQNSRNHEDIYCPGEHLLQNPIRAPMKEVGGFRRCSILYFSSISDPECTHFDYVVLCSDTGKESEAHCNFTLKYLGSAH